MSSVRELKKELNKMAIDLIDECYSIQLYDSSKKAKTDKFIDEVVDFLDENLSKINTAKTKKEYKAIQSAIDKKAEDWIEKLNKL